MSAVIGAKSTFDLILEAIAAAANLGASPAVQQLLGMELARINGIPQEQIAIAIAAQGPVPDPK